MFKHAFYLSAIAALLVSVTAFTPFYTAHAAEKGSKPTLNAFNKKQENGVNVWRANIPAKATPATRLPQTRSEPATVIKAGTKIRFKRSDIRARPATRSRIRVIGHYSGFGERAQVIQGFYSGYKNNRKRRFPLQRPDGKRRVTRRFY